MNELTRLFAQYAPRHFYLGGSTDEANPTDLPVVSAPEPAQNIQQLAAQYEPTQIAASPEQSAAMWNQYMEARKRATAENDALRKALETHLTEQPVDKSEMYFRLAAALAAPTHTQGIGEPMARAAEALAESRAGERKERQANMLKALEARQALAQLSEKEATDIGQLYSKYAKSGQPLSEAGKAAYDAGLKPGTKEFIDFVNNYNLQKNQGSGPAWANVAINQQRLQNDLDKQRLSEEKDTRKQVDLASKDMQTLENATQKLEDLKKSSTALSEHPGLSGISGWHGWVGNLPDSDAAGAQNEKENLEAKLQALGKEVSAMSGSIGAMATQEWGMLQRQIAAIDPVKLGYIGTQKALKDLNEYADRTFLRLKSQYEREHQPMIEAYPKRLTPNFTYKTEEQIAQEKELENLRKKHQDKNQQDKKD